MNVDIICNIILNKRKKINRYSEIIHEINFLIDEILELFPFDDACIQRIEELIEMRTFYEIKIDNDKIEIIDCTIKIQNYKSFIYNRKLI